MGRGHLSYAPAAATDVTLSPDGTYWHFMALLDRTNFSD